MSDSTDKRTIEQQIAVMDGVRERVLADPSKFNMNYWHSECGTTHCMAGWAQVNNSEPLPPDIITACEIGNFLAPDFAKFFYGPTEKALIWLRVRGYALAVGEVARDAESNLWVDAGANTYAEELTQEKAAEQAASNKNCKYCTDCKYCTNCTGCTDCTGCTGCKYCTGCTNCTNCTNCTGCTGCTNCTGCTDCTYCTYCTGKVAV